jgi:hypothetical protein
MTHAGLKDIFGAFCPGPRLVLDGAATGPLADTAFAAKDVFDIASHVTGSQSPRLRSRLRCLWLRTPSRWQPQELRKLSGRGWRGSPTVSARFEPCALVTQVRQPRWNGSDFMSGQCRFVKSGASTESGS